MNAQEKLEFRKQIIDDAVCMKKPAKMPHFANYWTWITLDAGYKISETAQDYSKLLDAYRQFQTKYEFDVICSDLARNPVNMIKPIGKTSYIIDDTQGAISIKDAELMKPEDYDLLINDLTKFLWTVMLPNKASSFNSQTTLEDFNKVVEEFNKKIQYEADLAEMLQTEFGVPKGHNTDPNILVGYELLFNALRGIRGMSSDMRRIPDKVKRACETLDSLLVDPGIDKLHQGKRGDGNDAFDAFILMLGHTILNPKQWDEFYWPSLKKAMDATVESGKKTLVFIEGSLSRYWDYFSDYPKGHFAFHLEQDDIFKFREKLPNICAMGGMPTNLLANGTEDECVKYAKYLIDELGTEGGFILSQDKMISYQNDTNPKNLKAVCDFVNHYEF